LGIGIVSDPQENNLMVPSLATLLEGFGSVHSVRESSDISSDRLIVHRHGIKLGGLHQQRDSSRMQGQNEYDLLFKLVTEPSDEVRGIDD
jgi:hypothetical protein